jgi:hypothetical protein
MHGTCRHGGAGQNILNCARKSRHLGRFGSGPGRRDVAMADDIDELVPKGTPTDVRKQAGQPPRTPAFDPSLNISVEPVTGPS